MREGGGMDRKWRCFQRRIEQAECSSMIGFLFLQSKDKILGTTYLSRKQAGIFRKFREYKRIVTTYIMLFSAIYT